MKACREGGNGHAASVLLGGLGLLMLMVLGVARPASGQHILDRYVSERFFMEAHHVLEVHGARASVRPPVRLRTAVDSLRPPVSSDTTAQAEESFRITERRAIMRLERPWFQKNFGDTKWAFLGASSYLTPLDTTFTHELRARLEAQFGPPTLTLADLKREEAVDEYIQFEYWFVVNDSIPAMVMDVHGPYDRGLIVATDRRFREDLPAFRDALLAPVLDTDEREPYVDYFYDTEVDTWYRTGYDGVDFFLEPVHRSRIVPGRRPWLDSMQAAQPRERSSSKCDS